MNVTPYQSFGERKCPGCACSVAANENRCPVCHYDFPVRAGLQANLLWVALLMLSVLMIPLFMSFE